MITVIKADCGAGQGGRLLRILDRALEGTAWEETDAADFCGVRSGREVDKFRECGLTPGKGQVLDCPTIEESPVSLECRVKQILELGSHDLFLAEVVCVQAEDRLLDEKGRFHMEDAKLAAYSHGTYYGLGTALGTFGFSVKKTGKKQRGRQHRHRKS